MLALAVTAQINRPRLHVDVHQVVDDPTLDVVLNTVDQESATNVNHFDERQIPEDNQGKVVKPVILKTLVQHQRKYIGSVPVILVRVKRLIVHSVTFNSFLKVLHGIRLVAILVVRT